MKRVVHKIGLVSVFPALLLLIAGCGGSGDKKSANGGPGAGQGAGDGQRATADSPEAVFQTAKTAVGNEDYEKFAQCLTPESQEAAAGGLIFAGGMMKAASAMGNQGEGQKQALAKIDEVFKKHGLDPEKLQEQGPQKQAGSFQEVIVAMGRSVDDKVAFIGDMMRAVEGPPMLDGELVDLKIDGDKATATLVRTVRGQERRQPFEFRKLSDGWRIHLPMKSTRGGPSPKMDVKEMGPGDFQPSGPGPEDLTPADIKDEPLAGKIDGQPWRAAQVYRPESSQECVITSIEGELTSKLDTLKEPAVMLDLPQHPSSGQLSDLGAVTLFAPPGTNYSTNRGAYRYEEKDGKKRLGLAIRWDEDNHINGFIEF